MYTLYSIITIGFFDKVYHTLCPQYCENIFRGLHLYFSSVHLCIERLGMGGDVYEYKSNFDSHNLMKWSSFQYVFSTTLSEFPFRFSFWLAILWPHSAWCLDAMQARRRKYLSTSFSNSFFAMLNSRQCVVAEAHFIGDSLAVRMTMLTLLRTTN